MNENRWVALDEWMAQARSRGITTHIYSAAGWGAAKCGGVQMTGVIATAADAGRSCPYCRFPLKEGAAAERCDSCNSLHHEDCWRDGGGCSVLGCPEAGRAAATASAVAAPPTTGWPGAPHPPGAPTPPKIPPTQTYPGYSGPAGYPPSQPFPPLPPRSGNQVVLVAAVIIALLGIGTGVVVATGAFSSSTDTNTPAIPTTAVVAHTSSQAPPAPTGPTPSEQASDRHAIMGILGAYQSAYSDHDLSGLGNIFTPEINRHGLAAGGCTVSRGRSAVLNDYQSQFEEGSGSYELINLSEGAIQFDSKTRAHLDAHYQITPGGTGYVNFRFAELGEGWKISEVYATCE